MTYLESYGPLALLIFVRTQDAIACEKENDAFATLKELEHGAADRSAFGRRGLSETSGEHDYIQFLIKVLTFYKKNY